MGATGEIKAVCISEKKGTVKKDIGACMLVKEFGLKGDAHAGTSRQVSLLSYESVRNFEAQAGMELAAGVFGENLLVSGFDPAGYPLGTRFRAGEALLELTQIGKTCHSDCEIRRKVGDCIMPRQGVFARVAEGGMVRAGDEIRIVSADSPFKAAVIVSSDRACAGAYKDESGPVIAGLAGRAGYEVTGVKVLPDDEELIYDELVRICDEESPDVVFTSGGTGFSVRDRVPEATLRAADRNAPGIAEAVRAMSMQITPRAMLSRAVSVIRGRTLIVNLPGSPKAASECMEFLLPNLEHGLRILRGEADG